MLNKPKWLNKKINLGGCANTKKLLAELQLNTVCEQAMCPNIGECFAHSQATFLILGKNCTRMCSFCNITKNIPEKVDFSEAIRVAQAVKKLKLKHVVVTSVTRDDLADGGAKLFAVTVAEIKQKSPDTRVELLIPDLRLNLDAIKEIVLSCPDIIGHNLETVAHLYSIVRKGADYNRSLKVIEAIKVFNQNIKSKSGLMLGLGEKYEEVVSVLKDLRSVKCDFLSIGQYLSPSKNHYPVQEYIHPEKFEEYKNLAVSLGFLHVESSPYVRSSYQAQQY